MVHIGPKTEKRKKPILGSIFLIFTYMQNG